VTGRAGEALLTGSPASDRLLLASVAAPCLLQPSAVRASSLRLLPRRHCVHLVGRSSPSSGHPARRRAAVPRWPHARRRVIEDRRCVAGPSWRRVLAVGLAALAAACSSRAGSPCVWRALTFIAVACSCRSSPPPAGCGTAPGAGSRPDGTRKCSRKPRRRRTARR